LTSTLQIGSSLCVWQVRLELSRSALHLSSEAAKWGTYAQVVSWRLGDAERGHPEDIPTMLQMMEAKIASSEIQVQHRDPLVRLRSILEEDLSALEGHATTYSAADQPTLGGSGDIHAPPEPHP
jgi:hypothetical protein